MAEVTVTGYGLSQLTTSGVLSNTLLTKLQALLVTPTYFGTLYGGGPYPNSSDNAHQVLVVTGQADLQLPSDAGPVVVSNTGIATITGGSGVVIADGSLDYTGSAATILASGATNTIFSRADGALIDVSALNTGVTGNSTVTGIGTGDTYNIDQTTGSSIDVKVAGGNSTINVELATTDTPSTTPGPASAAVVRDGGGVAVTVNAAGSSGHNTENLLSSNTDLKLGTADTVYAFGGNNTIHADGGSVLWDKGGTDLIFSSLASNTVIGGSGAETVYGSKAGDLVYTGASTDYYSGGGKDSIWGIPSLGGGTATVFAATGSYELVVDGTKGSLLIGNANATLDGANSKDGGLFFFAEGGNETLIGANSGAYDSFHIGANTGGNDTITIENFIAGDRLDLNDRSAADQQTAATAISKGQSSFTLSDGTTVQFTNGIPHVNSGHGYFFG